VSYITGSHARIPTSPLKVVAEDGSYHPDGGPVTVGGPPRDGRAALGPPGPAIADGRATPAAAVSCR